MYSSSHCRVKTPAGQEGRSEDAVEALDKSILPRASRTNIVSANPMLQEPFLHLRATNSLPLSLRRQSATPQTDWTINVTMRTEPKQ